MRILSREPQSESNSRGFTLVELVVVIVIIGIISTLTAVSLGTFSFWNQESFLRKLSDTIVFLHHQAVADQAYYALEFDLGDPKNGKRPSYKVGVLRADSEVADNLQEIDQDAGTLSLELAAFLNPSLGRDQTLIPPPLYPSLAEPVPFPEDVTIEDIRTMRGERTASQGGTVYIIFVPRGFSEFAVIHLRMNKNEPVTVLVNPFTGNTQIYREYKEFEWTYGRKNNAK